VLRVNAVHRDIRFTKAMTEYAGAEMVAQADWLGLRVRGGLVAGDRERSRLQCPDGPKTKVTAACPRPARQTHGSAR
jgi:hypothetical protein